MKLSQLIEFNFSPNLNTTQPVNELTNKQKTQSLPQKC